jgi:ribose transport system permease protein
MIATLAIMAATRSVITQLGQGGPFTVADAYYESFRRLAVGSITITSKFQIPYMMLILILAAFIFNIIMTRTKFGKHIYAVGSNPTAARLCGVNVHRVIIGVFAITGVMCGLGSVFYASRLTAVQASNAGLQFEMDAIAAVAIGGTSMTGGRGKVIGTFLGVLMFRMINNILSMANVPPFLSGFVSGCIIILVVLMQNLQNKALTRS